MAKRRVDYNNLRARLQPYTSFSFRKRKNENYTPAQKSAMTRMYNRLIDTIREYENNRYSFIPTKKRLRKEIDGIRTKKGIFYKFPGARLKKLTVNGRKQYVVVTKFKQRRDILFVFPAKIAFNLEAIMDYVDKLVKKWHPDYIMWSRFGMRAGGTYTPLDFYLYSTEQKTWRGRQMAKARDIAVTSEVFFNGVFFGWFPESDIRIKV